MLKVFPLNLQKFKEQSESARYLMLCLGTGSNPLTYILYASEVGFQLLVHIRLKVCYSETDPVQGKVLLSLWSNYWCARRWSLVSAPAVASSIVSQTKNNYGFL